VELLTIKGLRGGTTFLLDDQAPFHEVVRAVEKELRRADSFFRDSQIILHFGSRLLGKEEWRDFKELLHKEGLLLRYAIALSPVSREVLYKEGVPVREAPLAANKNRSPAPKSSPRETATASRASDTALYLRRSLRSGQKEVCEGNMVLVGDVNQGAEILAGGDVIVFGSLRGLVHAGYPDNSGAVVISLNLVPLQLRIGPLIARAEEGEGKRRISRPEIARVQSGRIVIEPLHGRV
jgi:septum site-determining protein MinC